jgi:hypothetical protein
MKKSLDEIIQKIELEKNSKKQQEQLIDDSLIDETLNAYGIINNLKTNKL